MKKILVIAVLAAAGYFVYRWQITNAEKASQAEKAGEKTALHTVARGDVRLEVSATGRITPLREVEIKCKASGEVKEVKVDISDDVKQGQLLFRLDPTDEQRSVDRLQALLRMSEAKLAQTKLSVQAAEAKLESDRVRAKAQLESAKAEREEVAKRFRRAQDLFAQKVITREELDTVTTRSVQVVSALASAEVQLEDLKVSEIELDTKRREIEIAESQLQNDRLALDDAEQRLKDTVIYAPIDGVIAARAVQEGQIISSGISNVGGGTTAMKVADLSRMYAETAVDEASIHGVRPGVPAILTADAFPGVEFSGAVERVAVAGDVNSNVVTFNVKVEVGERGRKLLKPEMTTNVRLLVEESKNTLFVPSEAVIARTQADTAGGDPAQKGRRIHFVTRRLPNGSEEEGRVRIGITNGVVTEILEGLNEGDVVTYAKGARDSRWRGSATRTPAGPPRL